MCEDHLLRRKHNEEKGVNFWFHLQFYGSANNCTILFLNWEFAWFLDNVLFFSYTHNKPVHRLHTYTLVFKGKEDSFIKHNSITYPVDFWKINSSCQFSGEIKLGGRGGGLLHRANVNHLRGILSLIKLAL